MDNGKVTINARSDMISNEDIIRNSEYKFIVVGAHGTGKTTLVNDMKERGWGPVLGQNIRRRIHEEWNIPINQDATTRTQSMMTLLHYGELCKSYGYISDRGLIDVVSYTKYQVDQEKIKMSELIHEYTLLRDFERRYPSKIVYIYCPIEFHIEGDGLRCEDVNYQRAIDNNIKEQLRYRNEIIDHYTVKGSREERCDMFEDIILKYV